MGGKDNEQTCTCLWELQVVKFAYQWQKGQNLVLPCMKITGKHNKTHHTKFRLDGNCKLHSSDQESQTSQEYRGPRFKGVCSTSPVSHDSGLFGPGTLQQGTVILNQIVQ